MRAEAALEARSSGSVRCSACLPGDPVEPEAVTLPEDGEHDDGRAPGGAPGGRCEQRLDAAGGARPGGRRAPLGRPGPAEPAAPARPEPGVRAAPASGPATRRALEDAQGRFERLLQHDLPAWTAPRPRPARPWPSSTSWPASASVRQRELDVEARGARGGARAGAHPEERGAAEEGRWRWRPSSGAWPPCATSAGLATNFDVVDAEGSLVLARSALVGLLTSYQVARAELLRVTGDLDVGAGGEPGASASARRRRERRPLLGGDAAARCAHGRAARRWRRWRGRPRATRGSWSGARAWTRQNLEGTLAARPGATRAGPRPSWPSLLAAVLGLSLAGSGAAADPPASPRAEVQEGPFQVTIVEAGTLQALRSVTYASTIQSNQAKIVALVPEGKLVKKGDLLILFDAAPFEEEIRRNQALLAQAQAELEKAQQDLKLQSHPEPGGDGGGPPEGGAQRPGAEGRPGGQGPAQGGGGGGGGGQRRARAAEGHGRPRGPEAAPGRGLHHPHGAGARRAAGAPRGGGPGAGQAPARRLPGLRPAPGAVPGAADASRARRPCASSSRPPPIRTGAEARRHRRPRRAASRRRRASWPWPSSSSPAPRCGPTWTGSWSTRTSSSAPSSGSPRWATRSGPTSRS